MDLGDVILFGFGVAATALGGFAFVRRVAAGGSPADAGSLDRWHQYALERGWRAHDGHDAVKLHGDVDGQPFSATATLTTRRRRRGRRIQSATSSFRAPIRGRAPAGLLVRRRAFANQVRGLFEGGRPIATGDAHLDDALLISGLDVDETVLLVRRPAVREALLALFRACPEAVVHERAVEYRVPRLIANPRHLDLLLGLMTTTSAAIEGYIDRLPFEGAPPSAPEPAPDLPEDTGITLLPTGSRPDPSPPTGTNARSSYVGPLYVALRTLGGASTTGRRTRLQHLRLRPHTYELEVRSVDEAHSRLGIRTGKLQVNGVLTRARWRVELVFDADHADAVLSLVSGDVIRGECLLEDLRGLPGTIEATARGAPILVERSRLRDDGA